MGVGGGGGQPGRRLDERLRSTITKGQTEEPRSRAKAKPHPAQQRGLTCAAHQEQGWEDIPQLDHRNSRKTRFSNGVAGVQSPLRRCTRAPRRPPQRLLILVRVYLLSWSVITLGPGVSDDRQRAQISGDERQSSVQSLTDKRGLLTRVN